MIAEQLLDEGTIGIEEARRFTGLGRTILYDLMGDGTLPYTKVGTRRLIPRRALIQILSQGVPSAPVATPPPAKTARSHRRQ
jgi:excisionase family DNA binding protein